MKWMQFTKWKRIALIPGDFSKMRSHLIAFRSCLCLCFCLFYVCVFVYFMFVFCFFFFSLPVFASFLFLFLFDFRFSFVFVSSLFVCSFSSFLFLLRRKTSKHQSIEWNFEKTIQVRRFTKDKTNQLIKQEICVSYC